MNKIAIITDSSCNLNSKLKEEFGVNEIVPMHYTFLGVDYDADGDWKKMPAQDYYNAMRNGAMGKSSLITSKEYADAFRKYLDQGYDVLSISCTGALSKSVNESYKAQEELKDQYPNQKIRCIDSANCTFSLSMLIKDAYELIQKGTELDEVVKWIEENKHFYNEVGTVDKLTYLRQAGRISASAAFFGGVFSVKPIVVYDMEGHNVAIEKVKGRKKSFETCADYIKKYANITDHKTIYIAHADCFDEAKELSEMIQARFSEKLDFVIDYIEPGVGSSVGPGTVIISFFGTKEMRLLNNKD